MCRQSFFLISCCFIRYQNNDNFEEGLLKLVRTLPKVLKFLPSDKAKDARNFVNSLQYWLGGNQENLENLLMNVVQVSGESAGELRHISLSFMLCYSS
jgi:magnesium chelatase subunit H